MIFEGIFKLRSSDPNNDRGIPPGETEIQRLNPNRELSIRNATGWKALSPGSLNLQVSNSVVEELKNLRPMFVESATDIIYPPGYEHIPLHRKAYWYYSATACKGNVACPVLVRRAMVPVPGVVELLAEISLTSALNIQSDDAVNVHVHLSSTGQGE